MGKSQIILAGLWTALMLVFLLGDVIRVFAGHFEPGKLNGKTASQGMWMAVAAIMLVPIVMLVLNLLLGHPAMRWVNIVVAAVFAVFNVFGLPYKGAYDNFLIGVSFVINGLTVWQAWVWVQ